LEEFIVADVADVGFPASRGHRPRLQSSVPKRLPDYAVQAGSLGTKEIGVFNLSDRLKVIQVFAEGFFELRERDESDQNRDSANQGCTGYITERCL
jgi:hypothetical protein